MLYNLLYNAEAFPNYLNKELKELEGMQLTILTAILELPSTTPYYALLLDHGGTTNV